MSFPFDQNLSSVVADWKRWHARTNQVVWQAGFFDHRLQREESLDYTIDYIRNNPVVCGLCTTADAWLWRINSADVLKALG